MALRKIQLVEKICHQFEFDDSKLPSDIDKECAAGVYAWLLQNTDLSLSDGELVGEKVLKFVKQEQPTHTTNSHQGEGS